jgi:hypothetical protein
MVNEKPEKMLIQELPRGNRKSTKCDFCGNQVKDETFLAVITNGNKNYIFHRDCYAKSRFDPEIMKNGDPECRECGHAYHRHYDLYEDEFDEDSCFFAGCKYCKCYSWLPKDDWRYPNEKET